MKIILEIKIKDKNNKIIIRNKNILNPNNSIVGTLDGMYGFPIFDDNIKQKISHFQFSTFLKN